MIIGRFKVQAVPEWSDRVADAIVAVETPSRALTGVVNFDITRSLTEPDTFMATEVFADRAAFEAQHALPELLAFLALGDEGAFARDYEWSMWEV